MSLLIMKEKVSGLETELAIKHKLEVKVQALQEVSCYEDGGTA